MSAYFASFDEMAHSMGYTAKRLPMRLSAIDRMLGERLRRFYGITDDQAI